MDELFKFVVLWDGAFLCGTLTYLICTIFKVQKHKRLIFAFAGIVTTLFVLSMIYPSMNYIMNDMIFLATISITFLVSVFILVACFGWFFGGGIGSAISKNKVLKITIQVSFAILGILVIIALLYLLTVNFRFI